MRLTLLATVLCLGVLTGCGGEDTPASVASSPAVATPGAAPTTPAPVIENQDAGRAAAAVMTRYLDAFLGGKAAEVCALTSPSFARAQLSRAVAADFVARGTSCREFVTKVVSTSKKANATTDGVAPFIVTPLSANDRTATVQVDYPEAAVATSDTYRLVRANSNWLVDADLNVAPPD